MDVHAPIVISAAGIYNTFERLLSKKKPTADKTLLKTRAVRNGFGAMSVYVGLKGTKVEFDLNALMYGPSPTTTLIKSPESSLNWTPPPPALKISHCYSSLSLPPNIKSGRIATRGKPLAQSLP